MTPQASLRTMRISPKPNTKALKAMSATSTPLKEIHMFRNFIALLLAVFALNAFAAVDANLATRADLETVKGIGPGLSTKIMDARKEGTFKNWNDLVERVVGIGPRNAGRLSQAGLTVAGAAFDGTAAAPAPAKVAKAAKADKAENAADVKKVKKTEKTAG
jgi:competence protein ComEA